MNGTRLVELLEAGSIDDAWYQMIYSLCGDDGRLRGDIIPAYLSLPPEGIRSVHVYNPDMRLIVMLREPVSRALSAVRMKLRWLNVSSPMGQKWRSVMTENGLVEKSQYARHMEQWLRVFPREQLLVIPYEKIAEHAGAVMADVCDFLAIDRIENDQALAERAHVGKKYKIPEWVREWFESRLANERTSAISMYPDLKNWWT